MSAYTSGVANSICASKAITVSSADASDEYISVDFGIDLALVPLAQIVDSSGAVKTSDAVITQASNGVIKVENGSSLSLAENDVVNIIVVRPKV